jgi:hypothetical protein
MPLLTSVLAPALAAAFVPDEVALEAGPVDLGAVVPDGPASLGLVLGLVDDADGGVAVCGIACRPAPDEVPWARTGPATARAATSAI